MLNVVLHEPEIPWNTGNIGRTCVAAGASLHLVGRLGFSLSERRIKRAGLDYWPKLRLFRHQDFAAFEASLPAGARLLAFAAQARRSLWEAPLQEGDYLLFGSESRGLPQPLLKRCRAGVFCIPMRPEARSLNLSTAVGVALYEALRRLQQIRNGARLHSGHVDRAETHGP